MSLLAKKTVFELPAFTFQNGRTLPVRLGYETFGTLTPEKDNVILVVHYFSASSHCAGKYQESDPLPGFWDGLIGPGKAVDTDKYFVTGGYSAQTGPSWRRHPSAGLPGRGIAF